MAVEISRLEAGLEALKADADSYREAFKVYPPKSEVSMS
jgi:hypothetical protein